MKRTFRRDILWGALCVSLAVGLATTAQAASITFDGTTTSSNYSPTGLNLGTAGFWFANFAASTPVSGAAVDSNDRNSLPSWVLPNFDSGDTANYSFATTDSSKGGQTSWAMLTLPDGETGLSGAIVDSKTANNSNNTIPMLLLGPGTPSKFRMSLVTDNTNGDHDSKGRIQARGEHPIGANFDADIQNFPLTNWDTQPDVYSWIYDGFASGDIIKIRLNSATDFVPASFSGLMFDVVPEPTSMVLMLLGCVGYCGCGAALRRR